MAGSSPAAEAFHRHTTAKRSCFPSVASLPRSLLPPPPSSPLLPPPPPCLPAPLPPSIPLTFALLCSLPVPPPSPASRTPSEYPRQKLCRLGNRTIHGTVFRLRRCQGSPARYPPGPDPARDRIGKLHPDPGRIICVSSLEAPDFQFAPSASAGGISRVSHPRRARTPCCRPAQSQLNCFANAGFSHERGLARQQATVPTSA